MQEWTTHVSTNNLRILIGAVAVLTSCINEFKITRNSPLLLW